MHYFNSCFGLISETNRSSPLFDVRRKINDNLQITWTPSHSHVQMLTCRKKIYLLVDKKTLSGPAASIGGSVRYRYAVSNVETIKTGILWRGLRPYYR
jgi:hypothetical protein